MVKKYLNIKGEIYNEVDEVKKVKVDRYNHGFRFDDWMFKATRF